MLGRVCVCRVSSEGFVDLALERYRGDEHGLHLARQVLHVRRDKDHQALEAELLGGSPGAPPADDGRRLSAVGGMLRDAEGAQATLEVRRCHACDLLAARTTHAAQSPPVACA